MKIIPFLWFACFIHVFAVNCTAQSQELTLVMGKVTIAEVLQAIEDQSEFSFFYNNELINVTSKVDIVVKNKPIWDILDLIFADAGITYRVVGKQIALFQQDPGTSEIAFQKQPITGTVTDGEGTPLPGVTVQIKGTTLGVITDLDGNFIIQVDEPNSVLVFSFVGYSVQEILLESQTNINVSMVVDFIGLDEVVVIGYGTQRRNDLIGSLTSVNTEQLEPILNTNLMKTLQGIVSGMRITQDNFTPGSEQEIRIRGENSLSASNKPLIILDGLPYYGDMNDINPSDIEQVSILKDASSAAIYGARSANGVILVTTKKGKAGKMQINLDASAGVASVAEKSISMLDGPAYISFIQEHIRQETGESNKDPIDWMTANEKPHYQSGTTTDWLDLVFRNAIEQNYVLSLSGGTGQTNYYTSLGYLDQPGIVVKSGFSRLTLRTNVTHNMSKWLSVGTNLQYSRSIHGEGGVTPSVSLAMIMSPYGKLREDNGEYAWYPQYPEVYFPSPFADDNITRDDRRNRALVNLFAEIKPTFIPGLSYRINFGADFQSNKIAQYEPSNSLSGSQYGGRAIIEQREILNWAVENLLNYANEWGNHQLKLTGLYSREATRNEWIYTTGFGFVNDDNLYHNMNSADTKDVTTTLDEFSMASLMGRLNYAYGRRYLLTVTARRDGYSGFGVNHKHGFFPSVALGWTISNEEFGQNIGFDFLKLRVSYGVNGNMAVDPYQTLDRYEAANILYGDNTHIVNGLKISRVGNPELKWEGTTTTNVGIDFAVLANMISGAVDVYKSNTHDLLMTRQVPVMNGYTEIWYNVGKTENKGIELSLNTKNIVKSDFNWSTSITFSLNRDKIVKLRGDGKDDIANNWFIGQPLRVHYGYEYDGLWQKGEEERFSQYAPEGTFELHLGKTRVKDLNGDGEITADDRAVLGSQLPSCIGGMYNELNYKNWSFSFFINTVQGIERSNGWYDPQSFMVEKNMNYLDVAYWRGDRPSDEFISSGITYDPGYPAAGPPLLKSASFVRVQNVTLSYELPQTVIGKIGIRRLRIYMNANNLLTFSSWLGWDPEGNKGWGAEGSIGQGYVPYPSARSVKIGVNLGL